MRLYTIGFTQKSAQSFFAMLIENNVEKLVDIRPQTGRATFRLCQAAGSPFLSKSIGRRLCL